MCDEGGLLHVYLRCNAQVGVASEGHAGEGDFAQTRAHVSGEAPGIFE